MDWDKVKGALKKVAPLASIALQATVPGGGLIGGLVSAALGVENDPDIVLKALETDPNAAIKLRQLDNDHKIKLEEIALERDLGEAKAETAKLESINKTYRAEIASDDKYVRRMRPTFGYVMAGTWGSQMIGITYLMFTDAADAVLVISAMAAMTAIWSVGLGVLGVYVYKRSDDKNPQPKQSGILNAIAKKIGG